MKMLAHLKKSLMQMDTIDDSKDGLILKDVLRFSGSCLSCSPVA